LVSKRVYIVPKPVLIIANKNYSSWSLRPWLALRQGGIPFDEIVVYLDQPESRETISHHSPSGRLPALRHGDVVVWDSLAIVEYVNEAFPEARLWPRATSARAMARAVSAEMHSGFAALRNHCTMNFRKRFPARDLGREVNADIARIVALWSDCRERFGREGPFLFGAFSGADCMYAPVVSRFLSYGIPLPPPAQRYVETIESLPAWREWASAADREPALARYEAPTV
jgi:glutathione S-transferase